MTYVFLEHQQFFVVHAPVTSATHAVFFSISEERLVNGTCARVFASPPKREKDGNQERVNQVPPTLFFHQPHLLIL
jgi:hypothetical protein